MSKNINLFSKLPKVDQIIEELEKSEVFSKIPRNIVVESIREEIDILREEISKGLLNLESLTKRVEVLPEIINKVSREKLESKLKRVVNATGVVIHTNLGRSLINENIMNSINDVISNYSNLEFDLESGGRGSRYSHLIDIIKRITKAEDALVVNNNAAAVMLVLSSMGKDKEVVVSRGELVEIGGSFRVPDVMEQSGAKLVDVGTTNKTHLWDYEKAISEDTAAFLKVHTSNYRILGFTSSVELNDLVSLGQKNDIPVIEDLGSGVLVDLSKYGLEYEPMVQDSVNAGVDVITFSGDKLLGGPQAGIIIGKRKYIDIMKRHPLNRALRIDKFTIAALEATLRLYLNEDDAINKIPTLRMLTITRDELKVKAEELLALIKSDINDRLDMEIVDEYSQVGGGSMPLLDIPSKAIEISSKDINITSLEKALRSYKVPIIVRIYKEKIYIDLRTVREEEFKIVANGIKYALDNI